MCGIKNICIVGGGNVGVSCAVDLSVKTDCSVTLLTSKPDRVISPLKMLDLDSGEVFEGKNIAITSDYKEALRNAELVIITVPSFVVQSVIKRVSEYSPKLILFTPGYGNKEQWCSALISKGCVISGFDRSPYICRLQNLNFVNASKKNRIRVGCINSDDCKGIADLYSEMFGFECDPLPNYMTVALTPSNPLLHTARLYSLFKDSNFYTTFPHMIKFYAEWTDESSKVMLSMDEELQKLCRKIEKQDGIDLSQVVPLKLHYESPDVPSMTKKIRSIQSFKNIDSPMIKKGDFYLIDKESRYFKEDFEFGLAILQNYARKYSVETPCMDIVMEWYINLK